MKSLAISGSVSLLFLAMIFVTFSYQNDKAKQIAGETFQEKPGIFSAINNLKGTIVSIQNNNSGTQTWIMSGRWKLTETPAIYATNSTQKGGFSADMTMIKIDGTGSHRHRLTDFKLSDQHFENGTYTVRGKINLVTQGKDEPGSEDQLIIGIPVKIQMFNLSSITIEIDKKVNSHFGNLPIYGIVA